MGLVPAFYSTCAEIVGVYIDNLGYDYYDLEIQDKMREKILDGSLQISEQITFYNKDSSSESYLIEELIVENVESIWVRVPTFFEVFMKYLNSISLIFILCLIIIGCEKTFVKDFRIYYVDNECISQDNDGLSIETPLCSIEQVNDLVLKQGDQVLFKSGQTFRGNLVAKSGSETGRLKYGAYGDGENPVLMGSINLYDVKNQMQKEGENIYEVPTGIDVGNIVIDGGSDFGLKLFSYDDLKQNFDYYYDAKETKMFIYLDDETVRNIEQSIISVELCLNNHIVEISNSQYVDFSGLTLTYGGAHGFAGSDSHHITITDCTISYIGGGLLHYNEEGHPIRYGNGFEIYGTGSDILIENCEIYQIFDTAVTNQGGQNFTYHKDIIYKNNTIHHCGMAALEVWHRGNFSSIKDISFIGNTVSDIGYGFSETQNREDAYGLGHYIIDFGTSCKMENVVIEGNTFERAYNEHGYSAFLLLMDIEDYKTHPFYVGLGNNEVEDVDYMIVYRMDDELGFVE